MSSREPGMLPPIATREDLREEFRWLVHELGRNLRHDVQQELQTWYLANQGNRSQHNAQCDDPIMTVETAGFDKEFDSPNPPSFLEDPYHCMQNDGGKLDLPQSLNMEASPSSSPRAVLPQTLEDEMRPRKSTASTNSSRSFSEENSETPRNRLRAAATGSSETSGRRGSFEMVHASTYSHGSDEARARTGFAPAHWTTGKQPVRRNRNAGSLISQESVSPAATDAQRNSERPPPKNGWTAESQQTRPTGLKTVLELPEDDIQVRQLSAGSGTGSKDNVAGFHGTKTMTLGRCSEDLGDVSGSVQEWKQKIKQEEMEEARLALRSPKAMWLEAAKTGFFHLLCSGWFVKSEYFDYMMGFMLILNAASIGFQVDYLAKNDVAQHPTSFRIIDGLFCIVFVSELLLRVVVLRLQMFTGSDKMWNIFDCVVVSFQVIDEAAKLFLTGTKIQETIDNMGVLRMLRLARILRLVRMVRLLPQLKSMVYLIAASMGAFLWTCALMGILIYCVAVYYTELCTDIVKNPDYEWRGEEGKVALAMYFGSMGSSFLSLFQAISGGDDWRNFIDPLQGLGSTSMMLMGSSIVMFAVYIAFATLVMLNLVTGVFVEGAQRMIQEEKDSEIVRSVRKLFNITDVDLSGDITYEEFVGQLDNKAMTDILKCLELQRPDARKLFNLLDVDRSGEVDVAEFVQGCIRLRGPSRSSDLCALKYDFDSFCFHLEERFLLLEEVVQDTNEKTDWINGFLSDEKTGLDNKMQEMMENAIVYVSTQLQESYVGCTSPDGSNGTLV